MPSGYSASPTLERFPRVTPPRLSRSGAGAGVVFESPALAEVFRLTKGYPYFLQEWGYQSWNLAPTSPITLRIVQSATEKVIPRLDENFFRVRFDRLTPSEKNFLRAVAELGRGRSAPATLRILSA